MIKLLANWILNAIALYLVSLFVTGVRIESFTVALVAVVVIGLINMFIKPILLLLTLPINLLTLGLFTLVINALLLMLAGSITSGFYIDGFWSALLGSLVFTVIRMLFQSLTKEK